MSRSLITAALLASVTLAACQVDDPHSSELALTDGTPDVIGLLAFLNDSSTTLTVLDDEVPLDVRAARSLIEHRDGPDGILGTSDDDLFDTVDEVDGVYYVGEASLDKLVEFARLRGYVPSGDDHLGTYDGVAFTVAEADRVLYAVNNYSHGVLDHEAQLDSRAADSIVNARPVVSMDHLASLYYVGGSALRALKDYTAVPAPGERADCRGNWDCPTGQRCTGIPTDGSTEYGRCYPIENPPGTGASCATTADCAEGTFCVGEIFYGNGIFCAPEWMRDSFTNEVQRYIPQNGDVVATSVTVYGLATVAVDIVVHLDLRHSDPHALRIRLRDPQGYVSLMWDGPNEGGRPFPGSLEGRQGIPGDDMMNGRYLLLIENVTGKGLGNLHGWTMDISSTWD